jgi:hypothetical protein
MRVLVPRLGAGGWRHGAIRPLRQEEIKVRIVQCGHLLVIGVRKRKKPPSQ